MTEKYVLEVDIDHETGEEHCTILKTDETTNMANWIEIVSAMYTHHSILEPLVDELNKIQNNYNNTEKYAIKLWEENEQLKSDIKLIEERADKVYDENKQLKQFISKIDFAIIRKYDNSLENLLDEVYDGEYENWIKKQVSRAKKLDGDFE